MATPPCITASKGSVQTTESKAVIDVCPSFFSENHPRFPEYGEMLGNSGHIVPYQSLQIADALFTVSQGIHHEQAARMTKRLKNLGLFRDILFVPVHVFILGFSAK